MKRIALPLFLCILLASMAFIPADEKAFPTISGTTLDGKNISLPLKSHGRFCVIAMVRSIKAEQDLVSWIEPVYSSLAGNSMFQTDMYFIPMIGGIKDVSTETVKRKLKESMDSSLYKYVLLYTGPDEEYVKALNMKDRDLPYLFVVDPRGNVTYSVSGKYNEKRLEEITDKLSE